ncbi:MAG: T9SS type A sorting domain-containing protein, partial [Ignavibacteriae bacterium]|nr:T9SS type A sorting domain-containing protein [Ignavibacteriota bacterium]
PDGTKFTGIATARNGEMTNFVVIDIATEKVLYEQRRIIYDHFNPDEPYYKWHSAEYSPDGNYIVSQLEFRTGSDSVYIYDANTFEVYDVVLNSFGEIVLNKYENLLATSRGKELILYNLDSKESKNIYFESQLRNIIFPMNENKIVLRIGTSTAVIYDYNLEKIANTISYRGLPKSSAKDNNLIYFGMDYNLALIKPDWDTINAINNLEKSNKSISPNPTTGLLNITLTNEVASFFRYEIISDSGQIIKTEDIGFLDNRNSQITINISTVVVGHYILKVFSNQEEFIFNVIKEG